MALPSQTYLSFFSGAGGLDLAVRLAVPDARCIGYVEIELPELAAITDYLKERVWTKATTELQTAGPSERPSWTPGQSGSS